MKKVTLLFILITGIIGFNGCKTSIDPARWTGSEVDKWFEKHEWLNGWNVTPDASINRKELVVYYFKNVKIFSANSGV